MVVQVSGLADDDAANLCAFHGLEGLLTVPSTSGRSIRKQRASYFRPGDRCTEYNVFTDDQLYEIFTRHIVGLGVADNRNCRPAISPIFLPTLKNTVFHI